MTTPEKPKRGEKLKNEDQTFWRKRATFEVAKSRHHRQVQYKDQVKVLALVLSAVIVIGAVVILSNWNEAGGTQKVNCQNYPDYCVPLVGGATGEIAQAESADSRDLYGESNGVDGVVRGLTSDNVPFIGDPSANTHFRVIADYSCTHCNDYHNEDLARFTRDYVLKGKAVLESVMTTGVGGTYSLTATQAAMCASEQGAFWEMSDELFRLSRSMGVETAYSLTQIKKSADDMGLDTQKLTECIASQRYTSVIESYQTFAADLGVTSTPTLLVRYGDSGEWHVVDNTQRSYANMKAMADGANTPGQ
jgi:protein-disulfide isomerase